MEAIVGIPIALIIGSSLALYMAWAIGANDVANAMGTSVGSGALTLRHAVVVAAVCEFAGAYFVGANVTDTVRKKMLDTALVTANPEILLYGMLAALAAAATLLVIATYFGLPVSTTHAIVGAIVGFGVVGFGLDAVTWSTVFTIVLSWATSPLIGGALAFVLFRLVSRLIIDREDPLGEVRRYGPAFFFYVFFIIGLVTLFKGLKNQSLDFGFGTALLLASAVGMIGMLVGWYFIRRVHAGASADSEVRSNMQRVERVFVVLQILTACALAFAHGSNDVANAIGPLAAVFSVVQGGDIFSKAPVEPWMLAIGGLGIVLGLATWGYRVIETVGERITELTPSRGFAAELAAATTIVIASKLGIPVSTTHILVGSVLGVGLARGIGALDLGVVGRIMLSWVATLPIAATLAIIFFYFFRWSLGG